MAAAGVAIAATGVGVGLERAGNGEGANLGNNTFDRHAINAPVKV